MSATESADMLNLLALIRTRRAALAGFVEHRATLVPDGDILRVIARQSVYLRYLNENRPELVALATEHFGRDSRAGRTRSEGRAEAEKKVDRC